MNCSLSKLSGWLCLSLGTVTTALAQSPATAIAAPALSAAAIRAHAEFLSNDLLEGRATGSRGYELAAAYVAAQFRQFGLLPLTENSYLQSVPLLEASVVLPGSSMMLRRDNINTSFEFSKDYLPSANFFNSTSSLTAPLVFVGYGIDAPEYKYNDFANVELQGRIAVLLEGAPERFSSEARNYYSWRNVKYAALVKQGALGVIEILSNERRDGIASSWERALSLSWSSELRDIGDDDLPREPFPELKLKFRLNSDAAPQLFGTSHSWEAVQQAARSGTAQGFVLPGAMTLSATTGLRRTESNNVLGMIRGSDPQLRNEYVLVTAHLDHLGRGPAVNGDSIYNGLQRNAVGVSMLLEMARSLSAQSGKLKRSVVFAAVTAGEKHGQGLRHLLASSALNTRNISASVALDTPLPVARTQDVLAAGASDSGLGVALSAATQQQGLRLVLSHDADRQLFSGELAPLLEARIPTLSIQSGNRSRGTGSAAARKRDWQQMHLNQPSDDLANNTLDDTAARELTGLNVSTVLQLANGERPRWYRSSFMYRKLQAEPPPQP